MVDDGIGESGRISKKRALAIQDARARTERRVVSTLFSGIGFALGFPLLLVATMSLQQLQAGLSPEISQPILSYVPLTGQSISGAYAVLAATVLAVLFGPSFNRRLRDVPAEEAGREMAFRVAVRWIAIACVNGSLLLGLVTVSAYLRPLDQNLDVVRVFGATLGSVLLSYLAAVAEARIEGEPNQRLRWASAKRYRKRVEAVVEDDRTMALSARARIWQFLLAFGVAPVILLGVRNFSSPSPNWMALIAGFVVIVAMSFVAFGVMRQFQIYLVGGSLGSAVGLAFYLVVLFVFVFATSAIVGLDQSQDFTHTAPLAEVMWLAVLTFGGPFIAMSVLTSQGLFGHRGLVFDSVMKHYGKQLDRARTVEKTAKRGSHRLVATQGPFSKEAILALLSFPILFISIPFAIHALRSTRAGRVRGRSAAIAAITLSTVTAATVAMALLWLLLVDPIPVWCTESHDTICLASR